MLGKMPNVTWPEGSFAETVKGWQSGWFYITKPRDTNWAAAPKFRSGVPMRLTSWQEKGLTWGSSNELTGLQTCVQNMITKRIKLVNMSGHAHSSDPSMPAPDLLFVGVRPGQAPDTARALRHDTRRHLESALQGRRDTTAHDRGSRA